MVFVAAVWASLLAMGRSGGSSSLSSSGADGSRKPHGYRPRKGAPSPPSPPACPVVRFQVCQSPACIADGAKETLEKMQAWAPAHVIVEAGACVSLCGSGPVVIASKENDKNGDNSHKDGPETKEKRIQAEARILQLLYPDGDVPTDLMEGYQLVQQGDQAFGKDQFDTALEFYERAVTVAFRSAVELENARDALLHKRAAATSKTFTRVPVGLEWLVRARRNEASCKLRLGDVDGAMLAAQASCNLSRNTSAESFLLLAEIYRVEESLQGEAQSLEKALSLWSNDEALTFPQKNQKRLASIRLQKVQREIPLAKPKVTPDDLVSLQQEPELEAKNGKREG